MSECTPVLQGLQAQEMGLSTVWTSNTHRSIDRTPQYGLCRYFQISRMASSNVVCSTRYFLPRAQGQTSTIEGKVVSRIVVFHICEVRGQNLIRFWSMAGLFSYTRTFELPPNSQKADSKEQRVTSTQTDHCQKAADSTGTF